MQKINVLIFTSSFNIGGSERQAVELIKRLDRSRFTPVVACFQKVGPLATELPFGLEEVHSFPLTGFVNRGALRRAREFISLLRRVQVQVIQCFDFYSNLFAIPLARLTGVPVILGCRRDEAVMRSAAQQKAEIFSFRFATGVIANAKAIKTQLVDRDHLRPEKVKVIHNGLDLNRFDLPANLSSSESAQDRKLVVAVVANLRPEKGHLVFLAAIQRLSKRLPHVQWRIVGDGSMREIIENRVKELGLTEAVQMVGAVTDVPSLLRDIDIAVLPSLKNEGLPNAVMEAMAAAKPVVGTDTGGTAELVIDGLTGYIVPAGDSALLADRLEFLCRDGEIRRNMGEAGRKRIIEQFSADHMARQFEALYHRLVSTSDAIS